MDMVTAFRQQAVACAELGSPMYEALLRRAADDIERGGVVRTVLAGHEEDPGPSALALRLAGSVHRLVLDGQAADLATFYPSVGGTWDAQAAWPAFAALLRDRPEPVRSWLDQPPQTNEVGRAAALLGGLLRVGERHRHPVRLLEIGSSAGLNLRADRFFVSDYRGRAHAPSGARVRLPGGWRGRPLRLWPEIEVVERTGSDVAPLDPTEPAAQLTLTAYVWPDQEHRLRRLRDAIQTAIEVPAEVRRQGAADFARSIGLVDGTTTVLWHSVMWQYLPAEEQAEVTTLVESLGASATAESPFANLFLEPTRRTPEGAHEFLVVLRLWPGGERRILGTAAPHGVPTVWE